MSSLAVPADRLWQGSVIDPQAFRPPGAGATAFDAVICIGVLPHVAETDDDVVIRNLQQAVMPGGLVIVEGRNQLFSLFTLNRYSHEFFLRELIRAEDLRDALPDDAPALDRALETLRERFRVDLPPRRMGVAGEPGYDEVLSRTHNPLVLREKFVASGMRDVRVLFYHYHCLPPMLEAALPDLFRRQSLAMEDPVDWRGYFMASAFLLVGRR